MHISYYYRTYSDLSIPQSPTLYQGKELIGYTCTCILNNNCVILNFQPLFLHRNLSYMRRRGSGKRRKRCFVTLISYTARSLCRTCMRACIISDAHAYARTHTRTHNIGLHTLLLIHTLSDNYYACACVHVS